MSLSENEKIRKKWRNSRAWKTLRHNVISKQKLDFLTNKKLLKGCQVHHLSLNIDEYKDLDENKYVALNKTSHSMVHFIFNYWIKDKKIIDRLVDILEKMEKYTYGDKI